MTSSESLQVSIGGDIWWGGFTAALAVTNISDQALESWSISFTSPHQLDPNAWGVALESEQLDNGLTRYTLSGTGWGSRIPAGETINVGFNGAQGTDLGRDGNLTEGMLFSATGLAFSDSSNADSGSSMSMDEASTAETSTTETSTAETSNGGMANGETSISETFIGEMPMGEASMAASSSNAADMDAAGMGGHAGHDHAMHQHAAAEGAYTDINSWGSFHGSNHNSEHNELVGGRTAITTEALEAYNGLRAFSGLEAVGIETVGEWAFANGLTNNSQAWGDDTKGVGLWYAMQGAKVGWIADQAYDPQILADIQRTARLGSQDDVMGLVREFGHEGFADYIEQSGLRETFINTLKMEPHYGGWMHGRTHGFLNIEDVAIAHDINHLTVLGWDQDQPFMNDTFDWPQWPALDVSDSTVINYYQGIVSLGDPLGQNLEALSNPGTIKQEQQPVPSPEPILPDSQPEETDQLTGKPLDVEVSGDLWWGGLTASLTVNNQSEQQLDNWSLSFNSNHRFYGESWGIDVTTEQLDGELYRYELSGADWGSSIGAGQSLTVGFNALSTTDLGRDGVLTEDMLLASGSEITPL
ncbi:cellulose binding domain-containing protein [Synechococcus sp. MIT S9504]|uniref:cellulose binding domain-containing protein n=1 Tax=Synechococcus sp. MIT S9504 TaxID=1801628 RepID=UPI0007BB0F23|nr:cellulose binding domain-containing protein [Synechococcus sp. MIT S9504]KZR86111.1 Cellulose binding domain protein [Synechococcus sp. MIT S9504]